MKTIHYIGSHAGDPLRQRLEWALVRAFQQGEFKMVTHSEAIHEEHADGTVTIASASWRENKVRSKRTRLNPNNWIVIDMPMWDVNKSKQLLSIYMDCKYDLRGAIGTALPFVGASPKCPDISEGRWICSEFVAAPYLYSAEIFSPSKFAAICATFGEVITEQFFNERK